MLDVTCFKWKPKFDARAVNVLRRMVARNLQLPHRFSCITDDATGIDPEVRVIPLWQTYGDIPSPFGRDKPSCYRRLKIFSAEARELIGERIVNFDLDVVITGDLTPLFDRPDDFVIWGGQSIQPKLKVPFCWYNGSLMMIRAGTRLQVWEQFDPKVSPLQAHRSNQRGSDQGWISYCLGKGESIWTDRDGVYSYRNHVQPACGRLPSGARVVVFHGKHNPWDAEVQRTSPWVKEFYH